MALGGIKGITIEFRGDTSKLDQALRKVKNEAKTTQNELKRIDKALKFNPKSVDMWRQKQIVLKQAIEQTKDKLDTMKRGLKEMEAQGLNSKNSEEFRQLQREIDQAERELKGFENQLRSIGNANLQALGNQLKSIGSIATDVGKKMTMYITAPLVGIGAVAAQGYAEVDKVMQLTNATMGNTSEQAALLNQAMKEAAANSTYGMTEAATATLNFARAGLTAEEAAAALAPAMNLAAGSGGDLDTVSAGLVATINGFHGSFDDAASYADIFANACNNSALDVNSLSEAMSVAAPVFSAAGYTVQDAALYMGTMANNGISADKAANSLKTGMARLVDPSKDAAEWMEKLGIEVTNADGSMKDSVQVQEELNKAFSGLSESEQIAAASAIFGKNQMAPWLALINTAPEDVQSLNEALEEDGTAAEMSANMMSGFGGALEKIKSSADVAKVSLGEALAPMILKVADVIQKAVDWFNNLSPSMQRVIAVVGVVVAAIGPLLVVLGTLLASIGAVMTNIGSIVSVVTKVGGVVSKIGGLMFNPWILAIAAAVAAGYLIYKNWDTIKAKAIELWQTITEKFAAIKETLANVWSGIVEAAAAVWDAVVLAVQTKVEQIRTVATTVLDALKTFIQTIWNAIKLIFQIAWTAIYILTVGRLNLIRNIITTVFNALRTFIQNVWNAIKTAITNALNQARISVTNIVNGIRNTITSVFNTIKTTVSNIANSIKSTVTSAFTSLKSSVASTWNSIKTSITTPITNAFNTLKGIVDKIKGLFPISIGRIMSNLSLPHISIGSKSKTIMGKTISVPDFSISWYAQGGIFDSPTVLSGVGEAGPEAVIPLDRFWKTLENNNAKTDIILAIQNRILYAMLEELQKDKDFKIDGRVAGRIINDLVRV